MIIKVCGLTDNESGRTIAQMPEVSHLGFIFYDKSPRYTLRTIKTNKPKIGVFVNEEISKIIEMIEEHNLSGIQLHGDETPDYIDQLPLGILTIKAIGISNVNDLEKTKGFDGKVDYFLFDTKSESYGGTGRSFDWSILNNYQGNTPFLLSGGIGLHSANEIEHFNHPKQIGFDLNSRFERTPGDKNVSQIQLFTQAVL